MSNPMALRPQILSILLTCPWLPFGWKIIAAAPGVLTWHEPMSRNGTGPFLASMSHFRAKKPFLKTSRRLSLTPYWSELGHMPTSKFIPGKRNETTMTDLSQIGFAQVTWWGDGHWSMLGAWQLGKGAIPLGRQLQLEDSCSHLQIGRFHIKSLISTFAFFSLKVFNCAKIDYKIYHLEHF